MKDWSEIECRAVCEDYLKCKYWIEANKLGKESTLCFKAVKELESGMEDLNKSDISIDINNPSDESVDKFWDLFNDLMKKD